LSYGRVLKPKFYTDAINFLKINGKAKSDILTDRAGTYNSGFDVFDLFDLSPLNKTSYNTSDNTGVHIVIGIDMGDSGVDVDYFALLNHNLNTAKGKIRIAHDTSAITVAGGGTIVANSVEILNSTLEGDPEVVAPAADGDTLFSFDSSSDRYWSIEIQDDLGFSSTDANDLVMGCAMLGEMYTMPFSPNLEINHTFSMGGVSVLEGMGGKRFAGNRWIKGNLESVSTNYMPFRLDIGAQQLPGRESYAMAYSTIADTDLLPSNIGAPSGNNFAVNVFSKTGWQTLPFIFTINSASTSNGDYLFARLVGDSYSFTQMAYKVHNTAFSIEQEF